MPQFMISMYQPDGVMPPPEFLDEVMKKLALHNEDIKASGGWVFSGGLQDPSTATTLRASDGGPVVTDGPYLEGKEHIGGFWIVEAPDLDTALTWAKGSLAATGLPTEVRAFRNG